MANQASAHALDEWREARGSIARYDKALLDLRKYGFGLATLLLTANGYLIQQTQLTVLAAIGIYIVILVLLVGLFRFDRSYQVFVLSSVIRAVELEKALGLKLTQEISKWSQKYCTEVWGVWLYGSFAVVAGIIVAGAAAPTPAAPADGTAPGTATATFIATESGTATFVATSGAEAADEPAESVAGLVEIGAVGAKVASVCFIAIGFLAWIHVTKGRELGERLNRVLGRAAAPADSRRPRVYLAGPEVFLPNAKAVGLAKRQLCWAQGLEGVFPLDNDAEAAPRQGHRPEDVAYRIGAANEAVMRACDGLIANLTPFRGASADVGTAYEMGFMRGLGKPVLAYSNTERPYPERIAAQFPDAEMKRTADGRPADPDGMTVEDFGLEDNLMLIGAVRASGGAMVSRDAGAGADAVARIRGTDGLTVCVDQARRLLCG